MPKAYPIIMSAESVRAILHDPPLKSQTRRIGSSYFTADDHAIRKTEWESLDFSGAVIGNRGLHCRDGGGVIVLRPKYVPGDLLWVRETWFPFDHARTIYKADATALAETIAKWRSPMHMPRWASRITLRVTASRIERLRDISEADAIAEGAPRVKEDHVPLYSHRMGFEIRWDILHRKPGTRWEDNPVVAVISFERLDGRTHDEVPG